MNYESQFAAWAAGLLPLHVRFDLQGLVAVWANGPMLHVILPVENVRRGDSLYPMCRGIGWIVFFWTP